MSQLALCAMINGQRIAIKANDVEAVVDLGEVVPVPLAPSHILGLAASRSKVMTVIDAAAAVGLPPGAVDRSRALVVMRGSHRYAIKVDAVHDVKRCDRLPGGLSQSFGTHWHSVTTDILDHAEGFALMLDLDALIAGPDPRINEALTHSN